MNNSKLSYLSTNKFKLEQTAPLLLPATNITHPQLPPHTTTPSEDAQGPFGRTGNGGI